MLYSSLRGVLMDCRAILLPQVKDKQHLMQSLLVCSRDVTLWCCETGMGLLWGRGDSEGCRFTRMAQACNILNKWSKFRCIIPLVSILCHFAPESYIHLAMVGLWSFEEYPFKRLEVAMVLSHNEALNCLVHSCSYLLEYNVDKDIFGWIFLCLAPRRLDLFYNGDLVLLHTLCNESSWSHPGRLVGFCDRTEAEVNTWLAASPVRERALECIRDVTET